MAHFVVDSDTIAAKSQQAHGHIERPVSYTHLTLPTKA